MLIDLAMLYHKYDMKVNDILHVGAHEAEESKAYGDIGAGYVFWVEANPDLFDKLRCRRDLFHNNTIINCAVTDRDGETIEFNVANNGQSSSILELGTHLQEHPWVSYCDKITVGTRTIDSLAEEYDFSKVNFLNLDIQGAELLALNGAKAFLDHVDYIYSEVNKKQLYVDCALYTQIDTFLSDLGFSRVEIVWTPHGWGDAVYCKRHLL